jgi:uncharacterized small protein (DUF1192 family)
MNKDFVDSINAIRDAVEGPRPKQEFMKPRPANPSTDKDKAIEADDMDRMVKIEKLIADMQAVRDQFGNTCVYIRRGGLSWGAVALNRRADDERHGVFDLQAQHDRDMEARVGQVERLIEDRNEQRQRAIEAEDRATTAQARIERLEAELDKCALARDAAGYLGTVPDCIADLACDGVALRNLEAALTPSEETKVAYMGEFSVPLPEIDDEGNEYTRQINVPWVTIKEIMAAIRARAALKGETE